MYCKSNSMPSAEPTNAYTPANIPDNPLRDINFEETKQKKNGNQLVFDFFFFHLKVLCLSK